jgi:hypothetical protein
MWLKLDCNKKNGPPGPGPGSRAQINIVPEAFGKHDLLEHAAARLRASRAPRVLADYRPFWGPTWARAHWAMPDLPDGQSAPGRVAAA